MLKASHAYTNTGAQYRRREIIAVHGTQPPDCAVHTEQSWAVCISRPTSSTGPGNDQRTLVQFAGQPRTVWRITGRWPVAECSPQTTAWRGRPSAQPRRRKTSISSCPHVSAYPAVGAPGLHRSTGDSLAWAAPESGPLFGPQFGPEKMSPDSWGTPNPAQIPVRLLPPLPCPQLMHTKSTETRACGAHPM